MVLDLKAIAFSPEVKKTLVSRLLFEKRTEVERNRMATQRRKAIDKMQRHKKNSVWEWKDITKEEVFATIETVYQELKEIRFETKDKSKAISRICNDCLKLVIANKTKPSYTPSKQVLGTERTITVIKRTMKDYPTKKGFLPSKIEKALTDDQRLIGDGEYLELDMGENFVSMNYGKSNRIAEQKVKEARLNRGKKKKKKGNKEQPRGRKDMTFTREHLTEMNDRLYTERPLDPILRIRTHEGKISYNRYEVKLPHNWKEIDREHWELEEFIKRNIQTLKFLSRLSGNDFDVDDVIQFARVTWLEHKGEMRETSVMSYIKNALKYENPFKLNFSLKGNYDMETGESLTGGQYNTTDRNNSLVWQGGLELEQRKEDVSYEERTQRAIRGLKEVRKNLSKRGKEELAKLKKLHNLKKPLDATQRKQKERALRRIKAELDKEKLKSIKEGIAEMEGY